MEFEGARKRVRVMMDSLARRGPDGQGIESWPGATLGHRRLSIFDLSDAGRQPMLSPDRAIGVVFNGAIYNFRPLRAELEKAGYAFRSNTDTEVLVHGYRHWGIDRLVERLRGMFAFAVWDDPQGKLYLVRDRLGVKPLAYAVRDGAIAFASTPRGLRAGGFVGEIDENSIAEYLEFGFITDGRTVYEGASKLPAASILEFSQGRTRQWQYWTLPEAGENGAIGFEEAIERTEELFLDAVRVRLDADVPVGALLSGGIDSSLVCWAVAKLGGRITAFTVGTGGDRSDETPDAVETAKQLGIRHQVIELTADQQPEMDDLTTAYAEPFACSSALGMLRVSRAVKPSATVLLTGDGGDDVFLGYPEHKKIFLAQNIGNRMPSAVAKSWIAVQGLAPGRGVFKRAANLLNYASGGVGAVAYAHDGLQPFWDLGLLGPKLAERKIAQRSIPWSPAAGKRVLRDFLIHDRQTRFTGEYMTKVDGGAMHYAIEARGPFLDQEIWNFAAGLPFPVRFHNGALKAVLREIVRRRMGDRVSMARKRGFTIPAQRWMAGRWSAQVTEHFQDSLLVREGWIRSLPLLAWWRQIKTGQEAPLQAWRLFVLECWLRNERQVTSAGFSAPAA